MDLVATRELLRRTFPPVNDFNDPEMVLDFLIAFVDRSMDYAIHLEPLIDQETRWGGRTDNIAVLTGAAMMLDSLNGTGPVIGP